jgi:hypothetical protein
LLALQGGEQRQAPLLQPAEIDQLGHLGRLPVEDRARQPLRRHPVGDQLAGQAQPLQCQLITGEDLQLLGGGQQFGAATADHRHERSRDVFE